MWHLLADIHFDIKTLPRLQSFFKFYFERFEQTRPKHVIFLGDTFNVRTGTDAHLHRVFSDYLRRMLDASQSPQIHLLVGNHDMKNRFDRTDNALYPFSLIRDRVKVYQEITQTYLDGHKAVFIPYHHDEAQVARYIGTEPIDEINSTIAFFHGTFRGAVQNGASHGGHAVCHDSLIDKTNLGRYHRAFLGHFHTHGSPSQCTNVTYVGSPVQFNMGDAGDLKRGYVEYDPTVDTWNLIVNPQAEYYLTMSWTDSVANPDRVRGKKVRVMLETVDQATGLWTDEAVQRHIDNLYSHEAHHVELRRAPQLSKISQPLPEVGEVMLAPKGLMTQQMRDDRLPTVQLMRNSVQSFLHAWRMEPDSIDVDDMASLTRSREEYMLSIIDDHYRHHGVVAPASTFHADLLRVEMFNFRGISGKSVFDLDALPPGTVFLVASNNGNGKSTLLEAIFWCLYGKFLDPEVSAEEIVHTGKRSCSVALYFRNGYTFTRSRTGKRPKFEINYRGTLVEQGHDAGTTTQYLESHLLHMTSETFRRTIVITDHANSAFLALRDAQRTKSLDLMFGLDILRELRSRLEQDFKENKQSCIEAQVECDKATDALKTLASLLQQCIKERNELKTSVECKERAIQDLRQSYDDIQGQLQTKKDSMENFQRSIQALQEEIARRRHQIKLHQTMKKVRRLQAEVGQYQVEMAREEDKERIWVQAYSFAYALGYHYLIRFIRTFSILSASIPWLNRFLPPAVHRSLTRLTASVLPPETAMFQDHISKSMDELRKSEALLHVLTSMPLTKSNVGHEDEDRSNANLSPLNGHSLHSMDKLELPHISQLVHQAEDYVGLAEQKQNEYYALLKADESDYSTLNEQSRKMSCNIAHQNGQLEEMIKHQDSWSKRAGQLTQQHQELIKLRKEKMDERGRVEAKQALSTFWLEQLQDTATQKGPFMTFCRAGYIDSLNALILKVLDELNQDSEGLAIQSLGFQLKADYTLEPTQGALSMGRRSKGQKTRTYLAFFLAMFQQMRSRIPLRTSFVFLDEVMDTLDLHGIEALQRWLQRYVAARGMQAFLLTHRETTLVGNVIEVIKDRKRGTVYKLRQEEKQG
jgi:hypothetical protein